MDKSSSVDDERLQLAGLQAGHALKTLKEAIDAPPQSNRLHIDASIQRFEYTFELFWKFLKRVLASEGIFVGSPKSVFREAYAIGLIAEEQTWLNMLNDRNMTSHTYNQEIADEIYSRLKIYHLLMQASYDKLKKESP